MLTGCTKRLEIRTSRQVCPKDTRIRSFLDSFARRQLQIALVELGERFKLFKIGYLNMAGPDLKQAEFLENL